MYQFLNLSFFSTAFILFYFDSIPKALMFVRLCRFDLSYQTFIFNFCYGHFVTFEPNCDRLFTSASNKNLQRIVKKMLLPRISGYSEKFLITKSII